MEKKLYRDEFKKVVAGVCAGLAEYFDIDVSIIRVVFLLTLLLKGGGVLIYIVLWIVLPKKGLANIPPVDYTMPPQGNTYQSAAPGYQQTPPYFQKKHPTTGALIGGLIMIMLGVGFILDQFAIIPDWDFEMWWPLILVVVGLVLIFSHRTQPPVFQPWQQPVKEPETPKPDSNPATGEENINENPSEKQL